MKTKPYQKKFKDNPEKSSLLFWICMSLTAFFLIRAPYSRALFNPGSLPTQNGELASFEEPIYTYIALSAVIFLCLSIYFFYQWKLVEWRDLLAILIWIITFSYIIALIPAASPHLAKNMIYIHCMYTIFYLVGAYMTRNKLGSTIIQQTMILAGYWVVLYGFANLFGNTFARDHAMLTDQGLRLTSVFQYANSYAAYLLALLFGCVYMIIISEKKYMHLLHSIMLVPIAVSFLLTLSRGGLVVAPFILLAILPFLSITRQILYVIHTLLGTIGAFIISSSMTTAGNTLLPKVFSSINPDGATAGYTVPWTSTESLKYWGILLATSFVVGGLSFCIQSFGSPWLNRKLSNLSNRKYSRAFIPVASIVLGSLGGFLLLGTSFVRNMLPDTLRIRLENINFNQHSVLERGTFYQDALKLFRDYPLFGAGGGAWGAMYEQYQNNPYTSRQAHSFFFQYLVETGIVGTLALLLILGLVFFFYIRYSRTQESERNFVFYIFTVALLAHSAIDFNMSYVYLGSLVFISLGGMSVAANKEIKFISKIDNGSKYRWIYPVVISILSLVLFVGSLVNSNSNSLYRKASGMIQSQKPFEDALNTLDNAIELVPDHPDYWATKYFWLISGYQQTGNEKYFEQLEKFLPTSQQNEPYSRSYIEYALFVHQTKGDKQKALAVLEDAVSKFPWDYTYYERAIHLNHELGKADLDENTGTHSTYWNRAIALYDEMNQRIDRLALLPKEQLQGREFIISDAVASAINEINQQK